MTIEMTDYERFIFDLKGFIALIIYQLFCV